jgi:hypothetical protein
MADRTPDHGNAPDHAEAPERSDATVRLDRRLTENLVPPTRSSASDPAPSADRPSDPAAAASDGPAGQVLQKPPPRDDRTVDLRKRDPGRGEAETARVDPPPPSPWAPPGSAPYPSGGTPLGGPVAGSGPWSAQHPPPSWPEAPPSWPAGPTPPPPWSASSAPPQWGSTRAMPQPPQTPPLPPARGLGTGPLIVFGILAALVLAGGAWGLISLAAGAAPFGPRADDPQASAPATPDSPILPLPPTTDPLGPDDIAPSGGPTGQVVVSWAVESTDYRATLTTAGPTGNAVVAYTDPDSGALRTVRQDVRLAGDGGQLAYVGSNPVDADTGTPADNYSPDIFLLTTNDEGKVSINQVCDTTGICSPATME